MDLRGELEEEEEGGGALANLNRNWREERVLQWRQRETMCACGGVGAHPEQGLHDLGVPFCGSMLEVRRRPQATKGADRVAEKVWTGPGVKERDDGPDVTHLDGGRER